MEQRVEVSAYRSPSEDLRVGLSFDLDGAISMRAQIVSDLT
jgi:hypothetical protein